VFAVSSKLLIGRAPSDQESPSFSKTFWQASLEKKASQQKAVVGFFLPAQMTSKTPPENHIGFAGFWKHHRLLKQHSNSASSLCFSAN